MKLIVTETQGRLGDPRTCSLWEVNKLQHQYLQEKHEGASKIHACTHMVI